jgi:hypothetical protein
MNFRLSLLLTFAALQCCLGQTDLTYLKLVGKWTGDPSSNYLGSASALSEKWAALGAPEADEQSANQGAVQIFSTTTGAFVRKLLPPTPALNQRFGSSVAISNDLVIVGAPGNPGSSGKAYVFNAATGALIRSHTASLISASDRFGFSLTLDGDVLAISAPSDNSPRIYLYSITTGAELGIVSPGSVDVGSYFGSSMDMHAGLLLVGAPFWGGTDQGRVYFFRVDDPGDAQEMGSATIPGTDANDFAGLSVLLHQGRAYVGCPGAAGGGMVAVFNPRNSYLFPNITRTIQEPNITGLGTTLSAEDGLIAVGSSSYGTYLVDASDSSNSAFMRIQPPGVQTFSQVALAGSSLLVGSSGDSTQGNQAGAGFLIRNVTRDCPLRPALMKGNFAAGVAEASYSTFKDMRLNQNGDATVLGGLSGVGSNSGKDVALWETLGGSPITLAAKTRNLVAGTTITGISQILAKALEDSVVPQTDIPATVIFQATATQANPPLAPIARKGIYRDNGTVVDLAFATGLPFGGGETYLSFGSAIAPATANFLAFPAKLTPGVASVTAATDSLVTFHRFQHNGNPVINSAISYLREGTSSGFTQQPSETSSPSFGELGAAPLGTSTSALYGIAPLTGPAILNQGIVAIGQPGQPHQTALRKGVTLAGDSSGATTPGVVFSSFLGLSVGPNGDLVFRGTLTGPGITTANNEGIWILTGPTTCRSLLRKGSALPATVPSLPNITIAGFKAFWMTGGQLVAWVTLKGTGVTTANDQAVILYGLAAPNLDIVQVLMREGGPAYGLHPAKIGVISQVEVAPLTGECLIQATLLGGAATKNLALFRCHTATTVNDNYDEQFLRSPYPILRKGVLHSGQPKALKSFSLPTNTRHSSGAGSIGLGTIVGGNDSSNPGPMMSTLVFDNGVTQAAYGTP